MKPVNAAQAMTSWTCSGWSMTEYHSARAAARRLPFSDSGRCSALSRLTTSSRAVRCDRLGRDAERLLVEIVERGQAAREEFAIDHALGKTLDAAEAHALGKLGDAVADQALVARAERGETVAHHDPVGELAVDEAALAARFAHHVGVVAFAGDGEIGLVERAEHVEVDEASR